MAKGQTLAVCSQLMVGMRVTAVKDVTNSWKLFLKTSMSKRMISKSP